MISLILDCSVEIYLNILLGTLIQYMQGGKNCPTTVLFGMLPCYFDSFPIKGRELRSLTRYCVASMFCGHVVFCEHWLRILCPLHVTFIRMYWCVLAVLLLPPALAVCLGKLYQF
jgi:hypothetical protein